MAENRQKEIDRRKKILTLVGININNAVNQVNAKKVVSSQTVKDLYDQKTRRTEEIRRLEAVENLAPSQHPASLPM